MIEPSKVKEAYKRIEEENYAFRAYLKNHADEDEWRLQKIRSSLDCTF